MIKIVSKDDSNSPVDIYLKVSGPFVELFCMNGGIKTVSISAYQASLLYQLPQELAPSTNIRVQCSGHSVDDIMISITIEGKIELWSTKGAATTNNINAYAMWIKKKQRV